MPKGHCDAGEISIANLCFPYAKGDSHLNPLRVQRNTREDGRGKRSLWINLHLPAGCYYHERTRARRRPQRQSEMGPWRSFTPKKGSRSPSHLVEDQRLKDYLKQKPLEGRKKQHSCVFWLSLHDCTPHWTVGTQPERPKAPNGSGNGGGENYMALGNTRRSDLSLFSREPKKILNQNLRAVKKNLINKIKLKSTQLNDARARMGLGLSAR